ncbi:MAG: CDP-alcohol phosphatidyltransferase family protein [Clostridia bacterium]|nr:CDP-alcohol phosphatidyltransferase family protein [Clostridia bacterium]
MKNIPNILSGIRLILVGVFIFLFTKSQYLWCMIVYIAAFLTDILDGYLARRNNWITNIGKVLDPLADKLMLMAVLSCFYYVGEIPLYVLIAVVCKEVLMIVIGAYLYTRKVVVYADWFGKIATGLFCLAILLTFCHLNRYWETYYIHLPVYWLAIATAIASFFHYGIKTFIRKEGNGRIEEETGSSAK